MLKTNFFTNLKRITILCLLLIGAPVTYAALDVPSGDYTLEATHGYVTFSYSHLGFSTPHVGFNSFTVDLKLDAQQPQNSSLSVVIDANSIDSRVDEFDEHLVGERFFDTANHPTITFVSTSIVMGEDNKATVTGDLTIKGQTHSVDLDVVLNKAGMHPMLKKPMVGINAEGTVKRSAWGLGYAVPMVGDEVNLFITTELQQAN